MRSSAALRVEAQAHVFAALGDPTRLRLVTQLLDGQAQSISRLTEGRQISRQAVTKHLSVLEGVGLVSKTKGGRESLYLLNPKPLLSLQEYLTVIAAQWDGKLRDLKAMLEK